MVGTIACAFVLVERARGDVSAILEMNGFTKSDFDLAVKKQRKEQTAHVLASLPMHKQHLVDQLKARMVELGNGKSTATEEDFKAVANSTYNDVHAATGRWRTQ